MIYAEELLSAVFDRLTVMIERGYIKAGTVQERQFMKQESERILGSMLSSNGINSHFPVVEVKWDPIFGDEEEISIKVDPVTVDLCKRLGIWSRPR